MIIKTEGVISPVKAGEIISVGERAAYVWSGVVSAERTDCPETVQIYQKGSVAGLCNLALAVLPDGSVPEYRLVAVQDSVISTMERGAYRQLLLTATPEVEKAEMTLWLTLLLGEIALKEQTWRLRQEDLAIRTYCTLHRLNPEEGYDLGLLARLVGTTADLVLRTMRKLADRGLLVRVARSKVRLMPPETDTCEAQAVRRYIN